MQTDHRELVGEVFCGVLEKLTFMFGEVTPKEKLPEGGSEFLLAQMKFTGPMTGELILAVPSAMAPAIAANVLGAELDDEMVEARSADALKEVLNVTCGHLLTEIAGETPVFDLSIPTLSAMDEAAWRTLVKEPQTVCFAVEELPVLLRLVMEGQPS